MLLPFALFLMSASSAANSEEVTPLTKMDIERRLTMSFMKTSAGRQMVFLRGGDYYQTADPTIFYGSYIVSGNQVCITLKLRPGTRCFFFFKSKSNNFVMSLNRDGSDSFTPIIYSIKDL